MSEGQEDIQGKVGKKGAYALLATSTALLAMEFSVGSANRLEIPGTGVSVPPTFLWLLWLYLLIPFSLETKKAKLRLRERFIASYYTRRNQFLWSTAQKKLELDPINVQFGIKLSSLENHESFFGLLQRHDFTGDYFGGKGGPVGETLVQVTYGPARIFAMGLIAGLRTCSALETLERFTLPIVSAAFAASVELHQLADAWLAHGG